MAKGKLAKKSERPKVIFFGALIVVLGIVFYYNFFTEDAPLDSKATQKANTTTPGRVANKDLRNGQAALTGQLQVESTTANIVKTSANGGKATIIPAVIQPLPLNMLHRRAAVESSERGNVFNYYVPPPVVTPPLPPQPPPPISIQGVEPNNVYARTGGFTLKLYGAPRFPADSKVTIDGVQYPTKVVNDKQLAVEIPTSLLSSAGQKSISVSSSDAVLNHSNNATLTVTQPPAPPYKFQGLVISGAETVAVLVFDGDSHNVRVGDMVEKKGRWKVTSINKQRIEFEDVQLKIRDTVPFTGESKQP